MTSTVTKPNGTELSPWSPWTGLPFPGHLGALMESLRHPTGNSDAEPGAEISESDDAFTVDIDLPGVDRKDVTIDVMGRRLVVRATRTERDRVGIVRHSTRVDIS